MARFGHASLRHGGAASLACVWLLALTSCHGAAPQRSSEPLNHVPPVVSCGVDEVREYFCDDLLPLFSARPAPEPYDSCPATTEVRPSDFQALGHIATFDFSYTAYTRRRVQPGHSCCYGWCAKVQVADPSLAAPSTCRDASGLQQKFCMRELERGTSKPAAIPFDHCPLAIRPPATVTFAAQSSVRLDVAETSERRRSMVLDDCCYSWCSVVPTGTLLKTQPNTK